MNYNYNFHDQFSLETNIPYFEGMFHAFRSEQDGKIKIQFTLEPKLKFDTAGKERINLMFYCNRRDETIELDYPWFRPIRSKFMLDTTSNTAGFSFNKNYLRLAHMVGKGWVLIDVFRSLLSVSLIQNGMYMLHGAAVKLGEQGVIIPAFDNTGKTTASWKLAKDGASFITDEFILIDSENRSFGFPCSSMISPSTASKLGINLTKREKLALAFNEAKSRVLSARFAPGGIRLYPDRFFKVCDQAIMTKIAIIQNGTDEVRRLTTEEALSRILAIQDYAFSWKSNPYILAQRFFFGNFDYDAYTFMEQSFLRKLLSKIEDCFLVSSTCGEHYKAIEKLARSQTEDSPTSVAAPPISDIKLK